ncbi:MAG: GNAT family N-acetyltransferase [Pseudomonadota bacterium]
MEIVADSLARRDWDRLAPAAAMQQAWAYGEACAALGSRILRLEIRRGRETLGLAQVVHRRLLGCLDAFVCTRGPIWLHAEDADTRANALRMLRKSMQGGRLKGFFTTPDHCAQGVPTLRAAGLARVMTPYCTARLDITRPEAEIRARMHQKWRNRLVVAEKAGFRVTRADRRAEAFQWLLEEETQQQSAKRYNALPPALVTAWHQANGDMRVLTAERDGRPEAAMLFLVHGTQATYHMGWTSAAGRADSAHNLLLWQGIRKLKAAGVATLDLGGLNTEDIPGIARFKLGTGAELRTLCGTWFGR